MVSLIFSCGTEYTYAHYILERLTSGKLFLCVSGGDFISLLYEFVPLTDTSVMESTLGLSVKFHLRSREPHFLYETLFPMRAAGRHVTCDS